MEKEVEGTSLVHCDGSATITIRMKEGVDLTQASIEGAIKRGNESWPITSFAKVERAKAVSAYLIKYSGGT